MPAARSTMRGSGAMSPSEPAAAVRVLSVDPLLEATLRLRGEVANPTGRPQTVKLQLSATGRDDLAQDALNPGNAEKTASVGPGEVKEFDLGAGERLRLFNRVSLLATDEQDRRLCFIERDVQIPALRFVKRPAPELPLVYIFPRFLPSLERLAVNVDYTAWARKTGYAGPHPRAEIKVFREGDARAQLLMSGVLDQFNDRRGTWRQSTASLPQGKYTVCVQVTTPSGQVLADYDDWFEKWATASGPRTSVVRAVSTGRAPRKRIASCTALVPRPAGTKSVSRRGMS